MKIGQTVVLMDSNDRGIILGKGRHGVKIELEDGLIIEAADCEFALTCDSEEKQMKASKPALHKKEDIFCRRIKTPSNKVLTVDLHIESLAGGRCLPSGKRFEYQLEIFRRVMRENLKHKGIKIIFIHGIGDGILKNAIRKDLNERFAVSCTYEIGDPAITTVTVK